MQEFCVIKIPSRVELYFFLATINNFPVKFSLIIDKLLVLGLRPSSQNVNAKATSNLYICGVCKRWNDRDIGELFWTGMEAGMLSRKEFSTTSLALACSRTLYYHTPISLSFNLLHTPYLQVPHCFSIHILTRSSNLEPSA